MGTPLTDLLGSPTAIGTVTNGITKAIAKSFRSHPMRHQTGAEVKRRFEICVKWFKLLRMEKKWSIDRAVSELHKALRAELDGSEYKPDERSVWAPEPSESRLIIPGR